MHRENIDIEVLLTSSSHAAAPREELIPYWRTLACAGRAAEGLRAEWRRQLEIAKAEVGYSYLRFHGIFHEEMMICRTGADGTVRYNFQYLDELFDYLLSIGIRPFLELGFMPPALASGDATCFAWEGNITPPADYGAWAELLRRTLRHCIDRYGLDEVRQWYFEVWNEPNLEEYFHLYATSARTLKAIDERLRVGGPATSNFAQGEAPWLRDFLQFCREHTVPVDFVSSHPYPNKWPVDPETGRNTLVYRGPESTAEDCAWLRETTNREGFPNVEIHITEWSSSFLPWDLIHDTAFPDAEPVEISFRLPDTTATGSRYRVKTRRIDRDHGSAFDAWLEMGATETLDGDAIRYLKSRAEPALEVGHYTAGSELTPSLPPHGLMLAQIRPHASDRQKEKE